MDGNIKTYFVDNKDKLTHFVQDIPWDKIMFYLSSHIAKNDILTKCSRISIFNCFRKAVSMNLNLDPSYGEVSFVPYWNNTKKVYEADLIPGYRAFVRIAHEIYGAKIFSGTFTHDDIKNKYFCGYDCINKIIKLDSTKFVSVDIRTRENISHVWVSIQSNERKIDHLYSREEIEERARYTDKMKLSSPWSGNIRKTDYEEMLKKTAIKHALKLMPWPEILRISETDYKVEKKITSKQTTQDILNVFSDINKK
jgi:recombinational DNA repair protein RecT